VISIIIHVLFVLSAGTAGYLLIAPHWLGAAAVLLAAILLVGFETRFSWQRVTEDCGPKAKILDTSVIIDGRIADICQTGFIEGTLIVPTFVLQELQRVADSSDVLKRNRGRRGLDTLATLQRLPGIQIRIDGKDFPDVTAVDEKLLRLAKKRREKLLTNDINLNKIAGLQGVKVLNINDLSNSVKTVVLPGEELNVKIIKEGKEPGQGVGYLDDGTMVVVENGRTLMNQRAQVVVTSVLQTTAGRMVFAKTRPAEAG
jgi:uncharacterized protein YacL